MTYKHRGAYSASAYANEVRRPAKREATARDRDARESVIQGDIIELLERAGWFVRVFSAHRAVPQQFRGWPDLVAFKSFGRITVVMLIECKSHTGTIRDSQVEFAAAIAPHLSDTLIRIVPRSVEDVEKVLDDIYNTVVLGGGL